MRLPNETPCDMIRVQGGRVVCPRCGRLTTQRVEPQTVLLHAPVYCKLCKTETIVNLVPMSQSHSASAD